MDHGFEWKRVNGEPMKRIAVVITDRQGEALRMAVGLILMDDEIDVYVLDKKIEESEENTLYLDTIRDMEMNGFTNNRENETLTCLTSEEIALRLIDYDHVLAY